MSPLRLAVLAFVVMVFKKGFDLVLENEYASWAPWLARVLVWVAGFIYPPRRGDWRADLLFEQQKKRSGLGVAGRCVTGAPWLALRGILPAIATLIIDHLIDRPRHRPRRRRGRHLARLLRPGEHLVYYTRQHAVALSRGITVWVAAIVIGLGSQAASYRYHRQFLSLAGIAIMLLGSVYLLWWIARWWFSIYVITNQHIIFVRGTIARTIRVTPLKYVYNATYTQSFMGNMLGYGELALTLSGGSALADLIDVPLPDAIYQLLPSVATREEQPQAHPPSFEPTAGSASLSTELSTEGPRPSHDPLASILAPALPKGGSRPSHSTEYDEAVPPELIARALINKAQLLLVFGRDEEALKVYDEILRRFDRKPSQEVSEDDKLFGALSVWAQASKARMSR